MSRKIAEGVMFVALTLDCGLLGYLTLFATPVWMCSYTAAVLGFLGGMSRGILVTRGR